MSLFLLPLAVLSITSYFSFSFFKNSTPSLIIFILAGILLSFIILRKSFRIELNSLKKFFYNPLNLSLIALIIVVVAIKAFVISPFVITKTINSFKHIQITPVGDYYKHSFFTSSIAQDGVPPKNPYFPASKLSYYLGYYFLPAALVNIFHLPAHWVLYIFCISTDLLAFLLLLEVICRQFKSYFYRLMVLGLIFGGLGVDSIPFVFNTLGQGLSDQGLQLNSIYEALLFIPQHFLPSAIIVWVIYSLLHKNLKLIPFVILSVFIFLSSIFVSLVYVFWLALLFLFNNQDRKMLFYAGLICLLLLIPYFGYLSDRSNLFYFYKFDPYSFTNSYFLNICYTFLIKYGLILLFFPILLLLNLRQVGPGYFFACFIPLAVTWFVRTPIFNDFSRKTSIPMQFVLAIAYIYFLQSIKSRMFKGIFIVFTIVTIILGLAGFYLEYAHYWKGRVFLHPKDSELIFKVRKLPKEISLAAIDKDTWVELIPSLAFKKVATPYLFDSYVYLTGSKISEEHSGYESQAVSLFLAPLIASDISHLIKTKNSELQALNLFFKRYPRDLLIINNKLWVKKDTNPWLVILKELGIKYQNLTPNYTGFNYSDLLEKTSSLGVFVDGNKAKKVEVLDRRVFLPKGLQFLATCEHTFPSEVNLEFEDYNLIFHKTLQDEHSSCIGQFFYLQESENLLLTKNTKLDYLYSFPVGITQINK